MSFTPSSTAFDAACALIEAQYQNTIASPSLTQAEATAAAVTFHRSVIQAGIANGVVTENSRVALQSLGAG
jgi:hypothetical protein